MSEETKVKQSIPPCDGILAYGLFSPGYVMISGEMIEVDELTYDEGMVCIPYPPKGDAPKPTPAKGTKGEESEVIREPKPDQKLNEKVLKGREASQASISLPPIARTPPEVKPAKPAE